MKDNCEKCGWPMTITAGGDEMHCGRKYYHNDYAFCLEKQNDKAQQELNAANERIKRLEEGGDRAILNSYLPDRIAMWNKAKEDKL